MKYARQYFCCFSLIIITLLGACAPRMEEEIVFISGQTIEITEDLLLNSADIILSGEVIEKKADYFSNPDGDKKQADGSAVMNARITEYIVKVDTVYKGEWSEDTISVKTYNDQGLTVDQALYGRDENTVVYSDIAEIELEMGECLLALSWFDAEAFGGPAGYMVTFDNAGYFVPEEDGLYANLATGRNHLTIDPTTLPDKIAALK